MHLEFGKVGLFNKSIQHTYNATTWYVTSSQLSCHEKILWSHRNSSHDSEVLPGSHQVKSDDGQKKIRQMWSEISTASDSSFSFVFPMVLPKIVYFSTYTCLHRVSVKTFEQSSCLNSLNCLSIQMSYGQNMRRPI